MPRPEALRTKRLDIRLIGEDKNMPLWNGGVLVGRLYLRLLCTVLLALFATPLAATRQSPTVSEWTAAFPSPARANADVAKDSKGEPAIVVAARQRGTLYQLYGSLNHLSGSLGNDPSDKFLTPANRKKAAPSRALRKAYWDAILANQDEWYPRLEANGCNGKPRSLCLRVRYMGISGEYNFRGHHVRAVAERYFPPAMREAYFAAAQPFGVAAPGQFREAAKPPPTGRDLVARLARPALGALALLFVLWLVLRRRRGGGDAKTSGNYGTADFAPLRQKLDHCESLFRGVFLGRSARPGLDPKALTAPVVTTPESHTLIVARTRTGKGTSVIVPTLLLYDSSIFVIDPKGENAAITARYRRDQLGHQVHIVNPWHVLPAHFQKQGFPAFATYNPLDVLDRNDPNVVSVAGALATNLCGVESPSEPHWRENAIAMITGILLWIVDQPGQPKTLAHLADLISGGAEGRDLRKSIFPQMIASSAFDGAMRLMVARFLQMGDKEYGSVYSNAATQLQFLADPRVKAATMQSSFRSSDIVKGKTTIYIIIPDNQMQRQATWLRLMLGAVSEAYKRYDPAASGHRGMLLIDEFPVLGRVDTVVSDLGIVSGKGLDITLVVQDQSQLKARYGQDQTDVILSQCAWRWYCNIGDHGTAEYISNTLGQMTVRTVSETISDGEGGTSRNIGETGRRLLFPDEIMALGNKVAFAFNPDGRPYYLTPLPYWQLQAYLSKITDTRNRPCRLPNLDKSAYDENPLRSPGGAGGAAGGSGDGAGSKSRSRAATGGMTRKDALDILGLGEKATQADIKAAYRTVATALHKNGQPISNDLLAQVNAARDHLLK
jgi:type IV secretory pathway TraG/TraD family ATPase VirD4